MQVDLTLDYVILKENEGSAIHHENGNLLIKNSQIRKNMGRLECYDSNISIVNSLIVENSQYAISTRNNSELLVSFSTISQNGNQPHNSVPGLDLPLPTNLKIQSWPTTQPVSNLAVVA